MAYQARTRDPLLETHMQEAIRKRGAELIGFAAFALSILIGAMLWSYTPEDPSWVAATSAPAQNLLGGFGAEVAWRLMLTIGWASWCLPALFLVWGSRFVLHVGEKRLLSRAISIPVFIAFSAVFLATHVPRSSWQHGFGLGGLSGDAALGILMDIAPFGIAPSLIIISLTLGFMFLVTGLFALGFSKRELSYIARYAVVAIILTYASIVIMTKTLVGGLMVGVGAVQAGVSAYRTSRNHKAQLASSAQVQHNAPVPKPAYEKEKTSFSLSLPRISLPSFKNTTLDSDLDDAVDLTADYCMLEEDRLRGRINDAIKSKVSRNGSVRISDRLVEPVVTDNIFRELPDDDEPIVPPLGGASRKFEDTLSSTLDYLPTRTKLPAEPELKNVVHPRIPRAEKQSKKAQAEAQPSLFKGQNNIYETPP
jgi:S-DNA-T family DNA segregation ATPase FtsK/SpoIIIE